MVTFRSISFKNKMLFSTLLVILLLSVGIAVASRLVLLPTLTSELKRRGLDIAQSIADSSRGYILAENIPELTSLIFDATLLEERKPLITYVFILDTEHNVLSHTFIDAFPDELRQANMIPPEQTHSIKLVRIHREPAYDIAVPILEGIYHIGTVHVGLSKRHIDRLIGKLATTFFGIISAITVIGFLMSHLLSKYITRPISQLTKVSDEISRGNLDIKSNICPEIRCWEIQDCERVNCPAHRKADLPCWFVDKTLCTQHPFGKFPDKLKSCQGCIVYEKSMGDEIVQLACSFNNMTHRLRASEANLRESEEKHRFLFDYDPNSIFVLEFETLKILDANARAMEVYGYEKEELIGESFMDLGPAEYVNGALSKERTTLSTLSSVYPKVQHWRKDRSPFYVNVYACQKQPIRKYGIIATTVDITDSLAKETQLIQAGKMSTLGEMATGVAHELNQPLTTIQIGADFIVNMLKQSRKIPEVVLTVIAEQMADQVSRAVRIINHLREFGRKTEIQKEKVDINTPVQGVFTVLSHQLRLRGIKIVLDLKDDLPSIIGDSNALEQAFIALVVNARDAMEEKKAKFVEGDCPCILTVKTFEENGHVVVTITDTGTGIPHDIKERIFEPFFTTKKVGQGTGLGLSISYGVIKDYNGTIDVESKVDKGTTFRIAFPVCDEGRKGV